MGKVIKINQEFPMKAVLSFALIFVATSVFAHPSRERAEIRSLVESIRKDHQDRYVCGHSADCVAEVNERLLGHCLGLKTKGDSTNDKTSIKEAFYALGKDCHKRFIDARIEF
jgi:hypothetical protein